MDVSFSAWRHSREESLQLKGDSFSFLFDRRYTNRLNRMSRVFFEAYVAATKELAAQEDRFPSLSEIDAKMESGAVYAFKDRLMKNTEFFEEVKISGVSYLVPRALKFVDVSGTYTDLILNFDEGIVVLPTRRKTPLPPPSPQISADRDEAAAIAADKAETNQPDMEEDLSEQKEETIVEAVASSYPLHTPEPFEEIASPEGVVAGPAPSADQSQQSVAGASPAAVPKPSIEPAETAKPEKKMAISQRAIVLLGAVALLVIAAAFFISSPPPGEPVLVAYSAYLSNTSNESYLGLDIANPEAMENDIEIALPPDIDQSISARGGVVTIAHGENTTVRLNSSSDASVKIYLKGNWTAIPVGLSFAAAEGFDSSLQVHGPDYYITRKNETLVLNFNLTGEGVSFEQSYLRKT